MKYLLILVIKIFNPSFIVHSQNRGPLNSSKNYQSSFIAMLAPLLLLC